MSSIDSESKRTSVSTIAESILFFFPVIILFSAFSLTPGWCGQGYVKGEIIIKLKPSSLERKNSLVQSRKTMKRVFEKFNQRALLSGTVRKKLSNIYLLQVKEGTEKKTCKAYARMPDVVYAEPNYIQHVAFVPSDPGYPQQWGLAKIQSEAAWDIETGSRDVIIAVVDTGIDYLHEDLEANIWHNPEEIPDNSIDDDGNGYVDDVIGWDFVDASGGAVGEDFVDQDNDPMDLQGHGTYVAGIAAAASDNGVGISGVSWHSRIMAIRAGYKASSGEGVLESDDAAQAILYAAENGAQVINLSWGDYQKSSLIADAIQSAGDLGALVCASAGNSNSTDFLYPAALAMDNHSVISVGAIDDDGSRAYFSNYGDWVDVSAPGVDIYSTYLNDSYTFASGTSLSAPHVAGLAALLFSHFPGLSSPQIKARIMRSVDKIPALEGKNITSGGINAFTALTALYTTPRILSLSLEAAHEGEQIILFGDRFGTVQRSGKVSFYPGIDAEIMSWSDCEIKARIPDGAKSGPVTVTTSEGMSNEFGVTILTSYYSENLVENAYLGGGTAQGWEADDQSWPYALPFSFSFFGWDYEMVYVCSNGFLDFTNDSSPYRNSQGIFKTRVMVAPLWDDLITNGTAQQNEGIFVHSPSVDSVCFRWVGESYATGLPVNVEVILYQDGRIQFNYGPGNRGLSPTIGLSAGDGKSYNLAVYDGRTDLAEAESILFTPLDQSFTISLGLGWNLVSFPLKPANNQIAQIMGGVSEGIESVWEYVDGTWHNYDPQNPSLSDLKIMKTGHGYWVKAIQQGLTIQINGRPVSQSWDLASGWNLIGFNSLQRMPVGETVAGLADQIESVWGYKEGAWHVYDPQSPGLSDLQYMDPGMGYWVKRKAP